MERVEQIKIKIEDLIEEAISILEKNYDMAEVDIDIDNGAYRTMMDLNGALMELDYLDEEGLIIKD
jgi:hypothetical protein